MRIIVTNHDLKEVSTPENLYYSSIYKIMTRAFENVDRFFNDDSGTIIFFTDGSSINLENVTEIAIIK